MPSPHLQKTTNVLNAKYVFNRLLGIFLYDFRFCKFTYRATVPGAFRWGLQDSLPPMHGRPPATVVALRLLLSAAPSYPHVDRDPSNVSTATPAVLGLLPPEPSPVPQPSEDTPCRRGGHQLALRRRHHRHTNHPLRHRTNLPCVWIRAQA